ncbi:MAG: MtrB/PioB family outer membrane beta-barrel protein [Elusimicrobia bacterium]|nr:MtrB/PioB family outer membrane beta-barrel protein [Elusimicrobiota bacterium]
MTPRYWSIAAALAALLVPPACGAAEIKQELKTSVRQEFLSSPNGGKPFKFEEYQTRPNGFVLDEYSIDLRDPGYILDCSAKKTNLEDQSYRCTGGRPGFFQYTASWNQIPHLLSNQAKTGYTKGDGGVLTLPVTLRAATTVAPLATDTAKLMREFQSSLRDVQLGMREDIAAMEFRGRLSPAFTVTVGADRKHKFGNRPIGGSFGNTGGSNVQELPEPIDYVSNDANLGLDYAGQSGQLGLRYAYRGFQNGIQALTWDNPQSNVDSYSATNKQAAVGRMPLAPENEAHTVSLSGGYSLPWAGARVSANAGYSHWKADNPMYAMTTNTALRPGNAAGTAVPCDLSNPASCAYPSHILQEMDIYTQEFRLSARPTHKLRGSIAYRSYILENASGEKSFNGWVAYDGGSFKNETVSPELDQFRKDSLEAKADYDLFESFSVGGAAGVEYEKRTREVDKGKDYHVEVGSTYKPTQSLFVNLSYLLGLRRMNGFDYQTYRKFATQTAAAAPRDVFANEIPGMRRFDVADRNRNRARLQVQYTAPNDATLGVSILANRDDYRAGKDALSGNYPGFTNTQYGLIQNHTYTAGLDASTPLGDSFNLESYYEADFSRQLIRANPGTGQFPSDDIVDRLNEFSHIGGIALEWLPAKLVTTTIGYDLVFSQLHVDPVFNGGGGTVVNAQSWPTTKRMLQRVKTSAGYKVRENVELTANYAFEKFDVTDFALDNVPTLVQPTNSPTNNMTFLGASLRGYYAHSLAMGVRYKF